jgi:hypothetical protein
MNQKLSDVQIIHYYLVSPTLLDLVDEKGAVFAALGGRENTRLDHISSALQSKGPAAFSCILDSPFNAKITPEAYKAAVEKHTNPAPKFSLEALLKLDEADRATLLKKHQLAGHGHGSEKIKEINNYLSDVHRSGRSVHDNALVMEVSSRLNREGFHVEEISRELHVRPSTVASAKVVQSMPKKTGVGGALGAMTPLIEASVAASLADNPWKTGVGVLAGNEGDDCKKIGYFVGNVGTPIGGVAATGALLAATGVTGIGVPAAVVGGMAVQEALGGPTGGLAWATETACHAVRSVIRGGQDVPQHGVSIVSPITYVPHAPVHPSLRR